MAPEIPGFCYWLPLYSSFYSFESNMSPRCRFVSSIKNSKTNNFVVKNCEFNIPFTLLLTTTLIINFIFSFNFRKSHYLWKFFRCEHFRNIRKSEILSKVDFRPKNGPRCFQNTLKNSSTLVRTHPDKRANPPLFLPIAV